MRLLPVLALGALGLAVALGAAQAGRRAGPEVNVSRLPGAQNEVNVAIDPSNDQVLLAGSNSVKEGTMRLYSSNDGGVTWTTGTAYPAPKSFVDVCAADPWAGIDLTGRQYFSFLRFMPCRTGKPRVQVVTRAGPEAAWSAPKPVAPLGGARFDDKPALAVDSSPASPYRNRVYVAWVRASRAVVFSILLSSSDDGGRTWSRPVKVNRTGREVTYPSVAVSAKGIVYVVWDDVSDYRVGIARSTDGGAHFESERTVAPFSLAPIPHCGSGVVIRAVRATCIHANPIVSVDNSGGPTSGRVYVSYLNVGIGRDLGIFVGVFSSRLRPLGVAGDPGQGVEVVPVRGGRNRGDNPDRFWPQSAVDTSSGALWVCFYDTTGDPEGRRAYYSCTVSLDGGKRFAKPVRAATAPSDETQPGADQREYGDYEGLAVANGVAHPMWTDSRDLATLGEEIYTTRLTEADVLGR